MENTIIWKPFPRCKGYEVSNTGIVREENTKRVAEISYPQVLLKDETGKKKFFFVHRIVAETFIDKPEGADRVNHIDGVKTNFNLNNLEWVNNSQNMKHAYKLGLAVAPVNSNLKKAIVGINLSTKEIKEWAGVREVNREIGSKGINITTDFNKPFLRCLNKWVFVYKKDYFIGLFEKIELRKDHNKKAVLQLNPENLEIIAEYESAREACQKTGANFCRISDVCKGKRKTAGGFSWKYKE